MSGSPLSPFVGVDKHPKYYADKLVEKMGGNPKDSLEDVLKLLQSKDAADFQHLTNMFEEFIRKCSIDINHFKKSFIYILFHKSYIFVVHHRLRTPISGHHVLLNR